MMCGKRLTTCLLGLALVCSPALAGRLYRWVDGQGNVHFSDKIPPSEVEHGRQVLNQEGLVTHTIERAKTSEELAKELEMERLRAEQRRVLATQEAADRVLLRTFRSEDDMLLARDGKLQALEVGIRVAQGNIRRYQARLAGLQHRAATLERSGKSVPSPLLAQIQYTLSQINESYLIIHQKEQQQQGIRNAFAQDIKRFRELRKITAPPPTAEAEPPKRLDNLIPCGQGDACDQAWRRAEVFVRKYATTPMQMLSDNIIMTAAPTRDDDISITVSRIREREGGRVMLFMDLFCKDSPLGRQQCAGPQVAQARKAYAREVGRAVAAAAP
jgi:Domain of unknown function (DUF4124)